MDLSKYPDQKDTGLVSVEKRGKAFLLSKPYFSEEDGSVVGNETREVELAELDAMVADAEKRLASLRALREDLVALDKSAEEMPVEPGVGGKAVRAKTARRAVKKTSGSRQGATKSIKKHRKGGRA